MSTLWPVSRVRTTFIEYFLAQNHTFVVSSSTIPHDDPTLLFANSGMNQFKPVFQGSLAPSSALKALVRVVNSQKCIRAGGKHNDLEDVGSDTYHHTFFEMMGNWSFGDYFKTEAITMAWHLLTVVYALPADRLYATYFEGDAAQGLQPDHEAKRLWLQFLPEDHILPGDVKDNFWEMGSTGPCGPCSELHYDRIGGRNAAHLVNKDDPDVLEIWNIVFMEYNREQDLSLLPLPNKHIDTGLGLERLVSILQDKRSNYDTDVFAGIFAKIQEITGARDYTGLLGNQDVDGVDTAYRVCADHIRTLTFAISDGCLPSNEGRGYVLRRILRRGARYARKKFNTPIGNFFSRLVDTGESYPEIRARVDVLKEVLDEEEQSFRKTLDRGEKLFGEYLVSTRALGLTVIKGEDVWRLYDTYGFPVDLTRLMALESGLEVDEPGFEVAKLKARECSRDGKGKDSVGFVGLDVHQLNEIETKLHIKPTNDSFKYSPEDIQATIQLLFVGGKFVESVADLKGAGERFGVILDQTNFYAEQGGQVNDVGSLCLDNQVEFYVEDVQAYGGYVLHIGYLKYGTIEVGMKLTCTYNELRRWPTRNNHTTTHILNYGLRSILGDVVDQKGSTAPTFEDLEQVEIVMNEFIAKNLTVYTANVSLELAQKISGLRAVFGEVYPDPVRVVSVGFPITDLLANLTNPIWKTTSIEFCGGTHCEKTGDIRRALIIEDSAISKGIRRIVGVTGESAFSIQTLAKDFEARVDSLVSTGIPTNDDPLFEGRMKQIGKDMDTFVLPLICKNQLRTKFNLFKKIFDDSEKVRKSGEWKVAVDMIKNIESDVSLATAGAIIVCVNERGNAKSVSLAINHVKTMIPARSAFLYATETNVDGSLKVIYQCVVSEGSGLNAKNWAAEMCGVIGGKMGGNEFAAQGSCASVTGDVVIQISDFASKFAKLSI